MSDPTNPPQPDPQPEPQPGPGTAAPGGYPPPPPPPAYGQPQYGQPQYGQPAPGQPQYGQPYPPPPYGQPYPTPPYGQPGAGGYAHWGKRVAATLLDALVVVPFIIIVFVGVAIAAEGSTTSTDASGYTHTELGSGAPIGFTIMALGYLAILAFSIWNQIFRQGRTGSSLGKKWMGIRVISETTGKPLGALMTFVRGIVHIVDGIACYIGYLWPLWDAKRQTFADKIMGSIVVEGADQPR